MFVAVAARKYHEHHRDEFPADLARLCEHFAAAAGMRLDCQVHAPTISALATLPNPLPSFLESAPIRLPS